MKTSKNNKTSILVVIPARSGSKGIAQKNLRLLSNKPLIYYSIKNALLSKYKPDVYVSSEGAEILSLSKKFGAKTIKRKLSDANDQTTLDPVVFKAWKKAETLEKKKYDLIITIQPTSPLLEVNSIDSAITKIIKNSKIDTIISAVEDKHLTWKIKNGKYLPNYKKRLNRQLLPAQLKETGGFLITRAKSLTKNNRIGKNVDLFKLPYKESIDIDNYSDWSLCEFFIKRKKILFILSGNKEIGMGHVYNCLILANDILDHDVQFLVDSKSEMAFKKIASKNFSVFKQKEKNIIGDVKKLNPYVVINDRLDNTKNYIRSLKKLGCKVINFEDLGPGSKIADLTINAIYPEKIKKKNQFFGHKYFHIRDEFLYTNKISIKPKVNRVLISFGGVDPNNYTKKVLSSIYTDCLKNNIKITVVTGFGYKAYDTISSFRNIEICKDVQNISDLMKHTDLAFTSAGRTIYEFASLNVPTIVLAQNKRELSHFFANSKYGFINLGLGTSIKNNKIREIFLKIYQNNDKRKKMSQLMSKYNFDSGRRNVLSLIKQIIDV